MLGYLPIHIPLGLAVIQLFWSYVLPLVFTGNPLAVFTLIVGLKNQARGHVSHEPQ